MIGLFILAAAVLAGTLGGLLTWAVATTDIDARIGAARQSGYDPGDARYMSRRASAGLLRWRLTPDTVATTGGTIPFLIDWLGAPHPASGPLRQLQLGAFRITHPDPDHVRAERAALGTSADVVAGETPSLSAALQGPRGTVTLASA